ncbi:ROK family protein [Lactobacillus sp. ESL0228]|uniref:ROK family protein n=1 Tax=Lactobacillus sp. ESL0228 TaxID=2069352 RepID=UPI000EFA8A56|nr:ROK family protein [Lactobacillus sp. ESL0228]RMC48971.1 ROK family protein [Lactobacillus sp. ESL0228]
MKTYLSIDIGGTEIKFAQFNQAGNVIDKGKVKTKHEKKNFLATIDQIIDNYSAEIKGIAFCTPGKVEKTRIRFGGALPFLDGVDFAQRYGNKLNIPVAVINDGKASILAESWLGSLKGEKNCAAITLGTAVGGGIIIDGHLLEGVHYQAGELSFMICNSSHLSKMAGSAAMTGSAVKFIQEVNHHLGYSDENDGQNAFDAIQEKNPEAVKIFHSFCLRIAILILNLQTVVDVTKIAIGGGISAQPILLPAINKAYDKLIYEINPVIGQTLTKPKIVAASFQNESNLYGALYNLLLQMNNENLNH